MSNHIAAIESSIVNLRANLARFRNMPGTGTADEALYTLRALAKDIAGLKPQDRTQPIVHSIQETAVLAAQAGIYLVDTPADDLATAESLLGTSWQGTLAATLLAPAWRVKRRLALDNVPAWLWRHYALWLVGSPSGCSDLGSSDRFALDAAVLLSEISRWSDLNAGSAAVRTTMMDVVRFNPFFPLLQSNQPLADQQAALAKIALRVTADEAIDPYVASYRAEERTRIKIGFAVASVAPTNTFRILRSFFEQLNREEFEILVFSRHIGEPSLESELRDSGVEVVPLQPSAKDFVDTVRQTDLDVMVYGFDLSFDTTYWSIIGRHRAAPLGLALSDWPTSAAQAAIDLRIAPTSTVETSAERIAVLSSSNSFIDVEPAAELDEEAMGMLRTSTGLPTGVPVFATAADLLHYSPDSFAAWGKILTTIPDSHLLWSLPLNANRTVAKFYASLLCISQNLKPSRIVFHFDDRRTALGLAQVYLDPIGYSAPAELARGLSYGVVPVSLLGKTARGQTGAELLKACGLSECVTTTQAEYVKRAIDLMRNIDLRTDLSAHAASVVSTHPLLTDLLARADSFGALIKEARRLQAEQGEKAFDSKLPPLALPPLSESVETILTDAMTALDTGDGSKALALTYNVLSRQPSLWVARRLHGRALSSTGQTQRGISYLIAALQGHEDCADLWWEIALALRETGSNLQAIQALEGCLRQDATRIEAWEMLSALATEAGHTALIEETASVLKTLRAGTTAAV